MPRRWNLTALVLSILAGALLIVSGTHGPVGIYLLILEKLPLFVNDAEVLSVITIMALILIVLSSLGGFTVILGGYLVYRNHVGMGKIMIGLGAGVGIPWLIFMLFTVMMTQELSPIVAQHSIVGWIGIILSFVARAVAR